MYSSDGGVTSEPCNFQIATEGTTELSWGFPDDTSCYIGTDSNCTENGKDMQLETKQKCYTETLEMELEMAVDENWKLYFMCGPAE